MCPKILELLGRRGIQFAIASKPLDFLVKAYRVFKEPLRLLLIFGVKGTLSLDQASYLVRIHDETDFRSLTGYDFAIRLRSRHPVQNIIAISNKVPDLRAMVGRKVESSVAH